MPDTPDTAPADACAHPAEHVHGYLALRLAGGGEYRVAWDLLHTAPAEPGNYEATATLGLCPDCGSRLVTVTTGDATEPWLIELPLIDVVPMSDVIDTRIGPHLALM